MHLRSCRIVGALEVHDDDDDDDDDLKYLHHEKQRVEDYEHHDEVLERVRHDDLPDAVLDGVLVLWRVTTHRTCVDDKLYALLL